MQQNFISRGHLFIMCSFYVNHMCDHILLLESTSVTILPQGPPLWNIYVTISSGPAEKSAEIPVAEGVQEIDPKDSVDEVVDALDT